MRKAVLWSPAMPGQPKGNLRLLLIIPAALLGVAAVMYALGDGPTDPPADVRTDPANTIGAVVETYINGFGGDPMARYAYLVDGHQYIGDSEAWDHHPGVEGLHPGDPIAVQYSAKKPWKSCLCSFVVKSR